MDKKIVGIGMSGGVDSSVAAYLLKEQGYKVIGITMKLLDDEKSELAIKDAKEVCDFLGIDHYVVDLKNDFKKIVINNFIECYKNGITPNPCVVCNKFFKFGLFFEKAKELGCNYIATGHYAKVVDGKLYIADVFEKDQSYFLYAINKDILNCVIFPLQEYCTKDEIREIAKKANLIVSSKKDSQEVCFVPNDDYKSFLDASIPVSEMSGDICLINGKVIGRHNGLRNYTVGQRKGLNISYSEPLYVVELDTIHNRLIVGSNDKLFKDELIAKEFNLLVDKIDSEVYAKVRSRGQLKKCIVKLLDDNKVHVKFMEKERAITLGQSVVFYNVDGCCLGGAIIEKVI